MSPDIKAGHYPLHERRLDTPSCRGWVTVAVIPCFRNWNTATFSYRRQKCSQQLKPNLWDTLSSFDEAHKKRYCLYSAFVHVFWGTRSTMRTSAWLVATVVQSIYFEIFDLFRHMRFNTGTIQLRRVIGTAVNVEIPVVYWIRPLRSYRVLGLNIHPGII